LVRTFALSLGLAGHRVDWRPAAQQAIEAADARTPDMVVLELLLAAHSGIEFLYEFRSYSDFREVPVLVLTDVPPGELAGHQAMLRRLRVSACCYKPGLGLRQLSEHVESLIGRL
jgi:CheY-like chemotaxis protein